MNAITAEAEDHREESRLSMLAVAIYAIIGIQLPFFPLFLDSRALNADDIGLIMGSTPLVRILSTLIASRRGDRDGRHGDLLVAFAVCAGLGYGLMGFAHGFVGVLAAAILVAALQGPVGILADGIILGVAQRRRDRGRPMLHYSHVRGWGSASILFFMVAAGPVARALPNSSLAWLLAAVSLATAGCAFLALRGIAPVGIHAATSSATGRLGRPGMVALVIAAAALIQCSHAMVFAFGSLHWKATGHDETFVSMAWSAGLITEVAFFLLAGRWFGGEGRAVTHLALGGAAAVLRWLIMASDPGTIGILGAQALHGLSCAAVQLGPAYLLARLCGPSRLAQAQSWLAAANAAGLSIATFACGPLYTHFGEHGYLAMAAMAATGFLLTLALGRSRGMVGEPVAEH